MEPNRRELLRRADRGVKTTEAWWAFIQQLWDAKSIVLPLLAVGTVMGGAIGNFFGWVVSYGWAGWIIALAAGFLTVCGLALAVCAVWYFALVVRDRRLGYESTGLQPATMIAESATVTDDLLVKIRSEFNERSTFILDTASRVEDDLRQKIQALTTFSTAALQGLERGRQESEDYTDRAKAAIQKTMDEVLHAVETLRSDHVSVSNQIFRIFRARDAEGLLRELASEIEEVSNLVDVATVPDPTAPPTDWRVWHASVGKLHRLIEQYWFIAEPYADDLSRPAPINHELYKEGQGRWNFDKREFPDQDTIQDYKTARIVISNHKAAAELLMERVRLAARA